MEVYPLKMHKAELKELEANGLVFCQARPKSGRHFTVCSFSGCLKRGWGVEASSVLGRGVLGWGLGLLDLCSSTRMIRFMMIMMISFSAHLSPACMGIPKS
jgi:hypothetical protein